MMQSRHHKDPKISDAPVASKSPVGGLQYLKELVLDFWVTEFVSAGNEQGFGYLLPHVSGPYPGSTLQNQFDPVIPFPLPEAVQRLWEASIRREMLPMSCQCGDGLLDHMASQ